MNTFLKAENARKIRIYDKGIHKTMWITVVSHQTNKKFSVTGQPENACKLKFADHLWLPFIDQPQSDVVVFEMINFQIYYIVVTKWKLRIGPNTIITFNGWLEFLST